MNWQELSQLEVYLYWSPPDDNRCFGIQEQFIEISPHVVMDLLSREKSLSEILFLSQSQNQNVFPEHRVRSNSSDLLTSVKEAAFRSAKKLIIDIGIIDGENDQYVHDLPEEIDFDGLKQMAESQDVKFTCFLYVLKLLNFAKDIEISEAMYQKMEKIKP